MKNEKIKKVLKTLLEAEEYKVNPGDAAIEFVEVGKTEFEIDKGITIAITGETYHRGIFFLPSGEISIDWDLIFNYLNKFTNDDKITHLVSELFDYYGIEFSTRFSSSYTEFLYPGSPGYGFSIHVEYNEELSDDEIEEDFREDFIEEYKDKINKKLIIELIKKAIDKINDLFYYAEKWLYEFTDEVNKINVETEEVSESWKYKNTKDFKK